MVNKTLTPLPMRRALVLTSEAARHPLTDLAFFGVSFVSWFVVIMGMIA